MTKSGFETLVESAMNGGMPHSGDLRGFQGIVFSDDGVLPAGLIEQLELSKAQIAAGHTVPLEPVLERMRAVLARMEARQAADDS
jgi:hypothetical protein